MGILNFFNKDKKSVADIEQITNEAIEEIREYERNRQGKPGVAGYTYRTPEMFGSTLSDWRSAVDEAWSEIDPKRTDLSDIYKAIVTYDSQTIAVINQRKLLVMQGDFAIYDSNGEINEQATKLFKTASGSTKLWFKRFSNYALDSIFWGHELIMINYEMGELYVKKIPERNVIPEKYAIMKDALVGSSESNLIYYNKPKYKTALCDISYSGDRSDLGLLSGIAPYFFSKVTGNWKMHADKYGMLTRVLKTDSVNKDKLASAYTAMKNAARGNFVVIGKDDELLFDGDTRQSVTIYSDLNNYCDSSISKIVLGQSSTTDEKSYAGSADVHKDILDMIIRSDREFLEAIINEELMPKLQMLGLIPQNTYFGISENIEEDKVELAGIIKTLSDAGFKTTKEYIEEKFDIPMDMTETSQPNPKSTENNTQK